MCTLIRSLSIGLLCLLAPFAALAGGASSPEDLGKSYGEFYKAGNIDGILSLYDLTNADPQSIQAIKDATMRTFGTNLLGIRFQPALPEAKAYSYVSADHKAIMWPTVKPVKQMLVQLQETNPPRGILGVPPTYTVIGKNPQDGRFYLVAFRREVQH